MTEEVTSKRDISLFQTSINKMIATSNDSYKEYSSGYRSRSIPYTKEEMQDIITDGDVESMSILSRSYFNSSGFYRRILFYYAYLLTYSYVVIPQYKDKPNKNKALKNYIGALDFCDSLHIQSFCKHAAVNALVDGAYYGAIIFKDGAVSTLDLPFSYCRTRFKGFSGLPIVEINLNYFYTVGDDNARNEIFKIYPPGVKAAYEKYGAKGGSYWYKFEEGVGMYFDLHEARPFFLNTITAIDNFEDYRDLEITKEELETHKIVVQQIPIDKDGDLIFEPAEAEELHRGAVSMLKNNKNMDVLTTYADVKVESLADSRQTINNNLQTFQGMIYAESGASSNIFAATGNLSLDQSLKNDLSLMMELADQFSNFFKFLINEHASLSNITYDFTILPISFYNTKEYIDETFKLASGGYSFILPALASGITQKQLLNLKTLENDILNLEKVFIPLSSSYTQGSGSAPAGGRPELDGKDKTEKTITNNGGEE